MSLHDAFEKGFKALQQGKNEAVKAAKKAKEDGTLDAAAAEAAAAAQKSAAAARKGAETVKKIVKGLRK